MELKLTIYEDRLCRRQKEVKTAKDFELSTAVCEEVMNLINIDMFEGGLEALSDESNQALMVEVIKNGYPYFVELVKEIFEITDSDGYFKVGDLARLMMDIVKYSITQLATAIGGLNNAKN